MFDLIDDTIVAVASPPGVAPRGIVRCSGPACFELAEEVFRADCGIALSKVPGFRRLFGLIAVEENCAVPGEMYLFRAPRSYTRQDCIEFHVPGSTTLLEMLVQRLIRLGARTAQPGEFTARAFLNGAMDLTQAEAVASVIRSRSDAQLRAARRMLEGRLGEQTQALLERVAELVALIEADIDFAEEPIEFIAPQTLKTKLSEIAEDLRALLAEAASSERIETLPRILLMGPSNAGKSTLMNSLSGMDRSICSAVAGTTRDLLSAPIRLGRGEAELLDSAGVDTSGVDALATRAGATTAEAAARVDLLCLVVDLSCTAHDQELPLPDSAADTPRIVVGNKIDLLDAETTAIRIGWLERCGRGPVCAVSARTGEGMDRFRGLLADTLHLAASGLSDHVIVLTARQREAIVSTLEAIERAIGEAAEIRETIDRADVLAFELREALEALGSVQGSVTTEDLLGRVFSTFCIGK